MSRTTRCVLPGRVWVCGRSAGRSDSCASREPPLQDWLDNWQPRGIPCGPISSRVCKPHLNTARFAGVQVLGVDEHVWHHQDRRRRGPRELTGIVDLTRGKEHPTARWLDLVPGRSGTVHENWLEERGEDFRSGIQIATLDPFQGQKERHRRSTPRRNQRPRCLSHRQASWGDAPGEVRRRVQQDTTGHRGRKGDPLYPGPQSFARLTHAGSPHVKRNASVRPSRQMRRISVSTSPTFTGQVREVFHQDTPAHGRHLAAHLVESLPRCPIPEIARLGANPAQMEGRTRRLLRHRRSQQRTPLKPSTDIIELGRRTARGYPNPTNYQLRMLLITGGLDASTHTQL